MHKVLEKQLTDFYGSVSDVPKEFLEFLNQVSDKYLDYEKRLIPLDFDLDVQSKSHSDIIIDNITSGIIEYSKDFIVLRINKAAENLLGVKKDDVIGKKIDMENIDDEKFISLARVLYSSLTKDSSNKSKDYTFGSVVDTNEVLIHHPIQRELYVSTIPISYDKNIEETVFIKVLRDITRDKIISKSKSEFISIVAHQLRTPLSAIKWAMWIIMDGDLGPLLPEQVKLLRQGYDTNEKMITLVNDLLNVSRIEEGRFDYEFKKASIIDAISSVVSSMSIAATKNNIVLKFEKTDEQIQDFVFDSKKISLVVQNVVDNAIKYTLPGGFVTINVKKNGEYVRVEIKDSGIGVPLLEKDRLFSKFFRATNVLHMETTGSGLGLFISKNIVSRHGGEIDVKSKEGYGSTFYFTLPIDQNLRPKKEIIKE